MVGDKISCVYSNELVCYQLTPHVTVIQTSQTCLCQSLPAGVLHIYVCWAKTGDKFYVWCMSYDLCI